MKFWKYQGAGNDFVMLDQRTTKWLDRSDQRLIENLCDRRFGIGGDGLIILQSHPEYQFEMIYFNADGRESSMCGNGGRCFAAFAHRLGLIGEFMSFIAIDGPHEAFIRRHPDAGEDLGHFWVELKMKNVAQLEQLEEALVLNTGSPHFVRFVPDVQALDMDREGRAVRYSERFKAEGINVNFAAIQADGSLDIRTYERGVEAETLACGTGVTAAVLARHRKLQLAPGLYEVPVKAQGGKLAVRYAADAQGKFEEIWLCGPATEVFEGQISIP